jgi:hypothetical protein
MAECKNRGPKEPREARLLGPGGLSPDLASQHAGQASRSGDSPATVISGRETWVAPGHAVRRAPGKNNRTGPVDSTQYNFQATVHLCHRVSRHLNAAKE